MTGLLEISADQYHADPCERPSLSASIAHTIVARSARHAWAAHPKLNPQFERKPEQKFDVGTVAHAILLQGADVVHVCHYDSWRKKEAQEARDEARAHGRVPLLAHQLEDVHAMVDAALEQIAHLSVSPPVFFDSGEPEQTLVWEDSGVLCRARLDWLHGSRRTIDDYKTTSASADPDKWTRTMLGIGADMQAAFYRRGVRALFGVEPEFRFVVQETYPPYALSVIGLGPDMLALADAKVEKALAIWKNCLAADEWPGYPTRVAYAELPAWEETRWLERKAREAA